MTGHPHQVFPVLPVCSVSYLCGCSRAAAGVTCRKAEPGATRHAEMAPRAANTRTLKFGLPN